MWGVVGEATKISNVIFERWLQTLSPHLSFYNAKFEIPITQPRRENSQELDMFIYTSRQKLALRTSLEIFSYKRNKVQYT